MDSGERYLIRNVAFDPDEGVTIDYLDTQGGIKANHLVLTNSLRIPPMPEYMQGLEELDEQVRRVLVDAIEDLSIVDNMELSEPEPEDNPEDD